MKCFRPFPMGWIEKIWDGPYAKAYPFLSNNAEGFPTPEKLNEITKVGNIAFEGDVRFDTEGSDMIKQYLLQENEEPLYLQSWGGVNTIVRALLSIYECYKDTDQWESIRQRVVGKARILGVSKGVGQDNSWLDNRIPDIYPGIMTLASKNMYGTYMLFGPVQPDIEETFKAKWMLKNVHNGKSELMDEYHLMGDGRAIEGEADIYQFGLTGVLDFGFQGVPAVKYDQYDFIGEGDSNTYIPLISFGLRSTENPHCPGLLGRILLNDGTVDTPYNPQTGKQESYNPFIASYQEDWAARARWTYQNREQANHAPQISIKTKDFTARPKERIRLEASVIDPDDDPIQLSWEIYSQYNHYSGCADGLRVWEPYQEITHFTVPEDAMESDYFIIILRAKDINETPMTSYATVVVNIAGELS